MDRRGFLASTGLTAAAIAATYRSVGPVAAGHDADMSSWAGIREQFGVSPEFVHMSSFFLASHPASVRQAIEDYRRQLDSNPLEAVRTQNGRLKVETAIAGYLGAKPEEIALTDSTTMGLGLVYHGLMLKAGQEILTTTHDHYSHHESIRLAAGRAGASVKKISLFDDFKSITEAGIVERIKREIAPKTRVVGVTWVHSSGGVKLPIRSIAAAIAEKNRGRAEADKTLLIVDGVHGLGVEDEAVAKLGADFFVAGTHKWMFGPRGTGIIWANAETWKAVRPIIPSFSGAAMSGWFSGSAEPATRAEMMTPGGFHSFEHRWAVPAAFAFHEQIGRAKIAARIHALNDQMKEGLAKMPKVTLHTPRGSKLSAGMVCFDVDGMRPGTVVQKLLAKKVIASTTPYSVTYARLAPSLLNDENEVDAVLRHVRELS
ncbi:MAG: aminotransferase class V-fold PLP-dependent enzyme [Chloracidobacterium sp.]|nr:aminotransferase class V-fold PLP-dependent enzyme [Chloracidobacterium sp.]